MKKVYYVLLAAACISCNQRQNQLAGLFSDKAVKVSERDYNLNSRYNKDSIKAFVSVTDETKKEKAVQLFNKAIDQYRNLKNYDSARYFFDLSLAEYPMGNTYYEEGNLLMDKKNYTDAIKSFNMAEYMNYQPASKIFYNMACAYALSGNSEQAIHFLEYALEAGYFDIDHIRKDPDLESIRDDARYAGMMNDMPKDPDQSEKSYWSSFREQFPSLIKPVTLNVLEDSLFEYENADGVSRYISYEFEDYVTEMRTVERFSREVNKEFYYYTKLNVTKDYSALVYLVKDYVNYDMPPLKYALLVTYNNSGKIIDKKMIAGYNRIKEPVMLCDFNKDNTFTIKNYDKTIRKSTKSDYRGTIVLKAELSAENWKISDKGKIQPVTQASIYLPFKFSLDKTIFG